MHVRRFILFLGLLGAVTGRAFAAEPGTELDLDDLFFQMDELSSDVALSGRQFFIPTVLGPTGMNGWINGETLVVREVENGSPADGIALPNDIILAVNDKPLGNEPLKTLGQQVEVSEQTGTMKLLVKRDGKQQALTLPIRKLGALSRDWPFDCAKSRMIHRDACEYLAGIQTADGMFDGRIYVGFALDGLTWLTSQDPQYMENARRLAYGYRNKFDPGETNTINWTWAYMGVFLAEYYLQTGDESIRPIAADVGRALARSQLPSGTWGHGPFPSPSYVQGGALNNCGLVCWMALVLLDEAGIEVDQEALAKSTKFFRRFTYNGGVPYGDHRPEYGGGNGKNSLPGIVLNILGDQAGSEYYARLVTGAHKGRTSGHTGGFMGFIWGNVHGAQNPHYPDYRRMIDYWGWLHNVSRRWDGGFLLPGSIIGQGYTFRGTVLSTGGMAQCYAMPNRVLRIHGGPTSVFAKQDLPADLAEGVQLYRARKFDELRQRVEPDNRMARQLLAAADRWEKDIELTLNRIEENTSNGNHDLAKRMVVDLRQATNNGRDLHRLGALNWQLRIHQDADRFATAHELFERNKWLTYTDVEARQVFEKLAADDQAGVYQELARRELATPDDASYWTYLCELIYTDSLPTWKIDPKARAQMLRAAGIRSGNWPQISAINLLQELGVLAEQIKDWTPIFAPWKGNFPGTPPQWKYIHAGGREGVTVPSDWTALDFDDSGWKTGSGPLGIGKGETSGVPGGPGQPYVRIPFNLDRTDFKNVLFGIRTRDKAAIYLNGELLLWSDRTQGPRMRMTGLVMVNLPPNSVKLLRKGKNVVAIKALGGRADFAMYGSFEEPKTGFKPRPKDWLPGPTLLAVDLSTKTPQRRPIKSLTEACTTGLTFDPEGQLNFSLDDAAEKFGRSEENPQPRVPLAERAKYLGHFDSRVRRLAAYSLMADGEEAMPYIIEALKSKDKRVARAGCDAIAGGFGMNGLGRGNHRKIMTSDIAGEAVPYLLPLVKHEDMYTREGALMALSNCGKAAAPHLKEIVKAADDEDWWVRAGVAYVLRYIEEPECGEVVESTLRNFLAETSIFGRNRFRNALTVMARRGHGHEAIVEGLIQATKGEDWYRASNALNALAEIGPNAKAALPLFEAKLAEAKETYDTAKDPARKKSFERVVDRWEGVIRKTNTQPEPPRPAKPPRKERK